MAALLFGAAIGLCGIVDNWNDEQHRNPWLGLFLICGIWRFLFWIFYIAPTEAKHDDP